MESHVTQDNSATRLRDPRIEDTLRAIIEKDPPKTRYLIDVRRVNMGAGKVTVVILHEIP